MKLLRILIIISMLVLPLFAQESLTVSEMTFNWVISDGYIDMELTSPDVGWVSVGFNPETMMKGADFYIGYVENGEVFIRDDYGKGRISHASDESKGGTDDLIILGGEETEMGTVIRFRIPLESGDSLDHTFVSGETIPVIFAYSNRDNFTSRHIKKGKVDITFNW